MTPCAHCGHPTYRVTIFDAYTDGQGRDHAASEAVADCAPDVAGTAPTATEPGQGIAHGHVCGVPRPLPAVTPDTFATSTKNSHTKRRPK